MKVIIGLSQHHSASEALETLRWKPLHVYTVPVRRQYNQCVVYNLLTVLISRF